MNFKKPDQETKKATKVSSQQEIVISVLNFRGTMEKEIENMLEAFSVQENDCVPGMDTGYPKLHSLLGEDAVLLQKKNELLPLECAMECQNQKIRVKFWTLSPEKKQREQQLLDALEESDGIAINGIIHRRFYKEIYKLEKNLKKNSLDRIHWYCFGDYDSVQKNCPGCTYVFYSFQFKQSMTTCRKFATCNLRSIWKHCLLVR